MDIGLRQRAVGLKQRWHALRAERQARWLARRVPPVSHLQLSQKTIFILPTLHGSLFGVGAIIVLVIAIAERNVVSFLVSALMLSVFLLSLVLCYRNLSGLRLTAQDVDSALPRQRCFVGDTAQFIVTLTSAGRRRSHKDLWLGFSADASQLISLTPGASITVSLGAQTTRRGLLDAPRLILRTRYPAGLWQAWSRPDLAMRCLVYPQPRICVLPPAALQSAASGAGQQHAARQAGVDDFVGLRDYQTGDAIRRVAWRSLARGQGLKTKQFVREADPQILLSFKDFAGHDAEHVLSCLCFQVLQLSRRRQTLALQLPGNSLIKPGQGDAHKHRLLQALALWI
ncbi:DUF58 domain-containing protein [Pseudohongiella sp.]|uniref:Uncharacterized protein n=1 Tax=marine sediment metagenome TaxID=412755 RepID=A0A0F9WJZ1_9ZZZZ|nr:DUF58 domain-containing protein [Pseudohongiella sp.]HDZ09503.1 DUF58 domain-containing protein [Pseudohongiella sp.]HEA63925.1 DUF58 domain-containing protein [Pseudohongiella sp.]